MAPDLAANHDLEAPVTVRFWAAARAAAGVAETAVTATTVGEARVELVRLLPGLESLLPLCSLLVDGVRAEPDTVLPAGAVVEVLPPFAGG